MEFRKQTGKMSKKTEVAIDMLIESKVDPSLIVKNCLNCDNWSGEQNICKKYNATPPPKIIISSCPDWENMDDEIPF